MLRRPRLDVIGLAAALCLAGVLTALRLGLGEPRGLRAAYFTGVEASGAPALTPLDREISSRQLQRTWRGAAPVAFSATWSGYLIVPADGIYTFEMTSDDAATLTIDGATVVDQPGRHGPITNQQQVPLSSGAHAIGIRYVQDGGGAVLELRWARDEGRLAPLPSWALAPRRVAVGTVFAWRAVDWAVTALLGIAAIAAAWLLIRVGTKGPRPSGAEPASSAGAAAGDGLGDGGGRTATLASLALFVVLAIAHTWPMARDPGGLSRNDNADTMLNEWIVAWVAHQLPHDPAHLFDANIFYPEPDTLAYSESMIVQSLMGAPILWLGGSPVLAYNLLVIAGFALSGWSMTLVMRRWTGSWTAALVAGCLYSFNAHSLTRIPHLQALHVEFLPPALYALDRVLQAPGLSRVAAMAAWFVLQSLTSIHLFVFGAFGLGAAALVRLDAWSGPRRRQIGLALAGGLALSATAMLPFLWPYLRVSRAQSFRRSLDVVGEHAATLGDYLSTAARLHYPLWSHHFLTGTALFPGVLALVLAALTLFEKTAVTNPRARMFLAIAVVGVVLSFGPKLPGYALLYHALPPLQAIRAVVRFGYLGIVGVAGLAGFGVLAVRRRIPARHWPVVAGALVATAALESCAAPLGLQPFDGIPSIYRSLADDTSAVGVELPFYDSRNAPFHAPYMLNSTEHWRPLLNGYSGFQPPVLNRYAAALRGFPDRQSLEALRTAGVTHVFVHTDRTSAESLNAIGEEPSLTLLRSEGAINLYRLMR